MKARLHRCACAGPAPGDDRAQLRGELAWLQQLNPARGAKLLRLFDCIDWTRQRTDA